MGTMNASPLRVVIIVLIALVNTTPLAQAQDDFALRDGDRVVLLGDSITAARTYGKIIENFTALRYPQRRVHFINAGQGGDTAQGGAARLDDDVFPHSPTVLIVAYGVNDIGWGFKADETHKQQYLDGIREIVTRADQRGVRVYVCSAAITHEDPDAAANGFLQQMCDEGMAIAIELGHASIDVQRGMREIQRRVLDANARARPRSDASEAAAFASGGQSEAASLHVADGVHLTELGQLAMAFVILKGLGAPAEVSHAGVDASTGEVTVAERCSVLNVEAGDDTVSFTRRDTCLPINFGLFGALQFRFVPIPEELNRYMLTVTGLAPGRYEVVVDDRVIGVYPGYALARGVNIASATSNVWEPGGPWDAQATSLIALTNARAEIATALQNWNTFMAGSADRPLIDNDVNTIDYRLRELQHRITQPLRYEFEITRVDE